jgi:ADP-ribose pyrophosphatase YjhB (NUDIX family)
MSSPDHSPWTPPPRIRPIAIALVMHAGRMLVMEGRDRGRDRTFYRPLGGGIEFGERGEQALRREFRVELDVELGDVRYRGMIESLYELHGHPGHELVLVYEADVTDRALYEREACEIAEGDAVVRVVWIPIADIVSGAAWLVPEALVTLIQNTVTQP